MNSIKIIKETIKKLDKIKNHEFTVNKAEIGKDIEGLKNVIVELSTDKIKFLFSARKEKAIEKHGELKNLDEFIGALLEEYHEVIKENQKINQSYINIEASKHQGNVNFIDEEVPKLIEYCNKLILETIDFTAVLMKYQDYSKIKKIVK